MKKAGWLMLALLAMAGSAQAQGARGYQGGQYRYWAFRDKNDLRDALYYVVPGRWHAQVELWDFVKGDDQLRLELGVHPRDARRSVYTAQYRAELHQDEPDQSQHRFWVGTGQVLSDHVVGRAELGVIASEAFAPQYTGTVGADYYWASWNFFSASAVRDAREGGLWTYPLRLRWATESNDWLQATVAPATERTVGWALEVKKRWLRVGVERNNRYDFTTRDNTIYTVGFEAPLGARP